MPFSQKYYPDLNPFEQQYNDIWFMKMLSLLKDDGVLFIPDLNKKVMNKTCLVLTSSSKLLIKRAIPDLNIKRWTWSTCTAVPAVSRAGR